METYLIMYEWNVETLLNTTKRQKLRIISIKGGQLFHAKGIASIFNENSPNLGILFQAHQKNQWLFSLNHISKEGLVWKSERSWLSTQSNVHNEPSQLEAKGKVFIREAGKGLYDHYASPSEGFERNAYNWRKGKTQKEEK